MTGNIALDVVIGLVFIYTLYSLLASTIVELVATIFQLRAKKLAQGITRMLNDKNGGDFAGKFYEAPIVKYMASGLWKFYNKPSYLQARNFSKALIYVLTENMEDGKNPIVKIKETLTDEKYKSSDTAKFLLSELNAAEGKLEKFKESLENWYNDTMERVTGWYKRRIWIITFITGLIIASALNVDSVRIVKILSRDPKARDLMVQFADQVAANTDLVKSTYDPDLVNRIKNDSAIVKKFQGDTKALEVFVADSVDKAIAVKQKVLIQRIQKLSGYTQQPQKILFLKRSPLKWYVFNSFSNFLGCLATALAISLGAPFWFDLLNKLVNLRGSLVKKGDEKK